MVIQGEALPSFDCWCPIGSLARVFQTTLLTVPGNVPYIGPRDEKIAKWAKMLPDTGKNLKVGLAWADPERVPALGERPLSVDRLTPLSGMSGVSLFNLQHLEHPLPEAMKVTPLKEDPKSLHDTAALIQHLDVVVGTDTAAAHVAAAMGKKAFILIPSTPDWRWMRDREDSPWYPSVRLFRQGSAAGWGGTVEKLIEALKAEIPPG